MVILGSEILKMFVQISIATVLGFIVGVERTMANKMAGMRTYGLISMGSALFVIISKLAGIQYAAFGGANPVMIASEVVVGIGFIGGGLIVVHGTQVKGITTAAGIWVAAGIGMAVGFELYSIAVFTTFLTLLVFSVMWEVEERIKKSSGYK